MTHARDRIGLEFISAIGMPPVAYLELAASLGCRQVSLGFAPMGKENPHDYPAWSLRDDAGLQRAVAAASRATGVAIAVGECFMLSARNDIADLAGDMDLMQGIGAERVNMLSFDKDRARAFDQCARFAEMAADRGMKAIIEYMPGQTIGTIETAAEAVRHAGRDSFGVLVDAMHFFRSGSIPADLAAIDPALIGHIQLCDVPLVAPYPDYGHEALYDRHAPGTSELPLRDFLAAAPDTLLVGLEIPMLAAAQAGIGPQERLAPSVAATVALLEQVAAGKAV